MQTFVTVVRCDGDATRAAEILGINQPSMSKRLAFLQHSGRVLRRPWLERVGKVWRLTDEGQRVLPAVEELVHRYRLLTEGLEEPRPDVAVGSGPTGAPEFVRKALQLFRQRRPDSTFRITSLPAAARVQGVANGSLDLAYVRLPEPEIADLARRPLFVETVRDEPFLLAAARDAFADFHGLPEKAIPLKTLGQLPLILPEPGSAVRRQFDRCCRDAGILDELRIVVEVSPWSTALHYVRDRVGIALLPLSEIRDADDLLTRALPGRLSLTNPVRVIARKRAGSDELDLSEVGRDFLTALKEACQG